MDFGGNFSKQSQLPIAFAGRNGLWETSGIKDGISSSEKPEFLISVGGRDTVRRILFDFPDLLD